MEKTYDFLFRGFMNGYITHAEIKNEQVEITKTTKAGGLVNIKDNKINFNKQDVKNVDIKSIWVKYELVRAIGLFIIGIVALIGGAFLGILLGVVSLRLAMSISITINLNNEQSFNFRFDRGLFDLFKNAKEVANEFKKDITY